MVGCIGPNGAGKSTTIKMLTGILVPSSGRVEVAGLVPAPAPEERSPGGSAWCSASAHSSGGTCRSSSRWSCCASSTAYRPTGTGPTWTSARQLLELAPFLDTPVRQLSLGQRMRGDLTAALLHDPEILYLDEPTIGLDVVAKHRIREFLQTAQPRARRHGAAHHPRHGRHQPALRAPTDY